MIFRPHSASTRFAPRRVWLAALLVAATSAASLLSAGAGTALAQPSEPSILVHVTETTSTLSEALSTRHSLWMRPGTGSEPVVIHVDDTTTYQKVKGVGAALTDSSAWLMQTQLASATRNALVNALFSAGGIHLNFLRIPVGASDFSATGRPYTYDDLPAHKSDAPLTHFSIAHDRAYIIPLLQRVLAANPQMTLVASPWSPPAWMKTTDALEGGALRPKYYASWANYLLKFLRAYGAVGVHVAELTPQNEPRAQTTYPSMWLPEATEATLIEKYLYPALRAAHLNTQIYGADASWGAGSYPRRLAALLGGKYLNGVAWHCYSGTPDAMSTFYANAAQLDQVVTECAPELTGYPVSEIVIGALRNWATAVSLWNVALESNGQPVQPPNRGCPGCRGIITIDPRTHTARLNLAFYQLGQVSKFVAPGARRIASDHSVTYIRGASNLFRVTSGIDTVAFLNPNGTRVLIAYNSSAAATRLAIQYGDRATSYTIPAGATTTFQWAPPGSGGASP